MKKILIIQNKRIGDVLIASILPNNLKRIYPDSHITFFCYEYAAHVLHNNPSIDRMITTKNSELKKFKTLLRTAKAIRQEKYDLIVDPYVKTQSQFMCLYSGAKERIAFQKNVLPFSYTTQIPFLKDRISDYGKAIDDRLNILKHIAPQATLDPYPKLFLDAQEKENGKHCLEKHGIDTSKKTIMMGVLGSNPSKSLPIAYVAEIIDTITAQHDVNILFNYIPAQKPIVDTLYQSLQNKKGVYPDVLGNTIREFIEIMYHCDLLIANEGGTVHIAKALEKPTFTIYSPYVSKNNWATFEDQKKHVSIHLSEVAPELFQNKSKKEIKETGDTLYQQFTPALINPAINSFLALHLSCNTQLDVPQK